MTFPPNIDAFPDLVQVFTRTTVMSQEGSRRPTDVAGATLRCSVQPVIGQVQLFQQLAQVGVQADYRAIFPSDPTASGIAIDTTVRQISRAGVAPARPLHFAVKLVQPDGGASLTWTAYLKFAG